MQTGDLGSLTLNPRGNWVINAEPPYTRLSYVAHAGSSWTAVSDPGPADEPGVSDVWMLSAKGGYFGADTWKITESGTWTPPAAGVYRIQGCAGGGGGGSLSVNNGRFAGGGGASGEEIDTLVLLSSAQGIAVTIGAGGKGVSGTSSADMRGTPGGGTSLGDLIALKGGLGGEGYYTTAATVYFVQPGGASVGPGSAPGMNGYFSGQNSVNNTFEMFAVRGGGGGFSSHGKPGAGGSVGYAASGSNGGAAEGFGAGGGGAAATAASALGGNGAPGYLKITRIM